MAAIVGIDLGTTYSAVAIIDETGRPKIVHVDGNNITPSCVLIDGDGTVSVGEEARRHWSNFPDEVAARFKREMGTSFTHTVGAQNFTPTNLSTFVLRALVQDAEKSIGPVDEAVVTIPANFSHEARTATLSAAKAAGLTVKFIINEPTAAALFYAFKSGEQLHGNYAVYDLGGGTFDVSVIRVNGQEVEVVASNGVTKLGGDDFDSALQEMVARKYKAATGEKIDPQRDYTKDRAENDKKSLSRRMKVLTPVKRENIEVTREEFEEAISTKIAQAEMLCESTLDEAGIAPGSLNAIFLAGGSTRIPLVRESVQRVFKREPTDTVNVDEVVALGAALYAAYKGDRSELTAAQRNTIEKIEVSESTAKCFGTISLGHDEARDEMRRVNSIVIRKGEKIPCSVEKSFYTVRDGQDSVNCKVTESIEATDDPRFVNIIWQGDLKLPPGRPANQEIRVTYAYDENQVMKCSFKDVATGRETNIDLSMGAADETDSDEIDKFIVE